MGTNMVLRSAVMDLRGGTADGNNADSFPLTLMPGLMRKNWDMVRLAAFQMVGQLSPCTTWYH